MPSISKRFSWIFLNSSVGTGSKFLICSISAATVSSVLSTSTKLSLTRSPLTSPGASKARWSSHRGLLRQTEAGDGMPNFASSPLLKLSCRSFSVFVNTTATLLLSTPLGNTEVSIVSA